VSPICENLFLSIAHARIPPCNLFMYLELTPNQPNRGRGLGLFNVNNVNLLFFKIDEGYKAI